MNRDTVDDGVVDAPSHKSAWKTYLYDASYK